MLVVFRVDASKCIGTGHVMRCLTLAEALSLRGVKCLFVCRTHENNLLDRIRQMGFETFALSGVGSTDYEYKTDEQSSVYADWLGVDWRLDAEQTIEAIADIHPDWLIVDHYGLDASWESKLRDYTGKIMVIDDLSNRYHDCDILLDQTFGKTEIDYEKLVTEQCKLLIGSSYTLLRSDFKRLRPKALKRKMELPQIERILISMGSMDETNLTPLILESLLLIDFKVPPIIDIVLTSNAPHLSSLREIVANSSLNLNILLDVTNMAELMLKSDLAIGSGGTTSWERCCMALPTILIVLADNQAVIGKNLEKAGATITLNSDSKLVNNMKMVMNKLIEDKQQYNKLSKSAAAICDGEGTKNVIQRMFK